MKNKRANSEKQTNTNCYSFYQLFFVHSEYFLNFFNPGSVAQDLQTKYPATIKTASV
jgi:hypothetical protein